MLNSLKIKLKNMSLKFQKKHKPGFVNPYAPALPESTSRVNPYVTDYGTKKKKSMEEMIMERVMQKKGVAEPAADVVVETKEPTFFHDMKEMFVGDLLTVANKFPKRKVVEKTMSADEIRTACENTKWQ